jgi:hypothetical protein
VGSEHNVINRPYPVAHGSQMDALPHFVEQSIVGILTVLRLLPKPLRHRSVSDQCASEGECIHLMLSPSPPSSLTTNLIFSRPASTARITGANVHFINYSGARWHRNCRYA